MGEMGDRRTEQIERRISRGDIALAGFAAAFAIADTVAGGHVRLFGLLHTFPLIATAIAVASCAALLVRRRYPLAVCLWQAAVHALCFAPCQLLIAAFTAGTSAKSRTRMVVAATGACLSGAITLLQVPTGDRTRQLLYLILTIGAAITLGISARAHTASLLRHSKNAESRAADARAQERARIAQEMHDVVAHQISLMVLDAGALEVSTQLSNGGNGQQTEHAAARIRQTGRRALEELRQILGVLRAGDDRPRPPLPTLSELDQLVDEMRASGEEVTLHIEGHQRRLAEDVERVAYRIIQEALTNATKHAPGAAVDVRLSYELRALDVRVRNGAPRFGRPDVTASGHGLIGLEERVALVGGTVSTGHEPDGGFLVHARLPLGDSRDQGHNRRRRGVGARRIEHDPERLELRDRGRGAGA